MDEIKKIGVIGAGSFGTALAMTLTQKGYEVTSARDSVKMEVEPNSVFHIARKIRRGRKIFISR